MATEIRFGDETSFVALQLVPHGQSGIAAKVELLHEGFAGRNDQVWFFKEALARFAAELAEFARERPWPIYMTDPLAPDVSLESMSPRETILRIQQVHWGGLTAIAASIMDGEYIADRWFERSVSATFEVSRVNLSQVAEQIATMLSQLHDANRAGS